MGATIFRNYRDEQDVDRQYELWLRATAELPYAWRSNLTNVRHVTKPAGQHPRARLYAERDGQFVGYIGTHPPVQWPTGEWLIPFGFPWTHPRDPKLEVELYDRMFEVTPQVYGQAKPPATGLVQRFRGSWDQHLQFLSERGWKMRWRRPILGRRVANKTAAAKARRASADDLPAICALAAADARVVANSPDVAWMHERLAGGWLELESLRLVPGLGAFEMEARRPWGEVRMLYTAPEADRTDDFWNVMDGVASELGAAESYVTTEESEAARRQQLTSHGFAEVDAGVYVVREL